jgi:hypothetical protein
LHHPVYDISSIRKYVSLAEFVNIASLTLGYLYFLLFFFFLFLLLLLLIIISSSSICND